MLSKGTGVTVSHHTQVKPFSWRPHVHTRLYVCYTSVKVGAGAGEETSRAEAGKRSRAEPLGQGRTEAGVFQELLEASVL